MAATNPRPPATTKKTLRSSTATAGSHARCDDPAGDRPRMMVMGCLLSPKRKKKSRGAADDEAGHREALLEQQQQQQPGGVPKGCFAVYVGEEARRRFVVPTGYLREPAFRDLMERTADEFGFAQAGGLRVPCAEGDFQELLRRLRRKNGAAGAMWKKALLSCSDCFLFASRS